MTTTAATTQAEAMPVHDFVWTDGTRVRTTWAETRVEADRIAKQFKRDGAYFSGCGSALKTFRRPTRSSPRP
jgi:hypothetical protein